MVAALLDAAVSALATACGLAAYHAGHTRPVLRVLLTFGVHLATPGVAERSVPSARATWLGDRTTADDDSAHSPRPGRSSTAGPSNTSPSAENREP
jgi:hypothetical protein